MHIPDSQYRQCFCNMHFAIDEKVKLIGNVNDMEVHVVGNQEALLLFFFLQEFFYLLYMQGHNVRKWLVEHCKLCLSFNDCIHLHKSGLTTRKVAEGSGIMLDVSRKMLGEGFKIQTKSEKILCMLSDRGMKANWGRYCKRSARLKALGVMTLSKRKDLQLAFRLP